MGKNKCNCLIAPGKQKKIDKKQGKDKPKYKPFREPPDDLAHLFPWVPRGEFKRVK